MVMLKNIFDTPLIRELEGKIALGRGLLEKLGLHKLRDVEGVAKLEKKVFYSPKIILNGFGKWLTPLRKPSWFWFPLFEPSLETLE